MGFGLVTHHEVEGLLFRHLAGFEPEFARTQMVEVKADPVRPAEFFPEKPDTLAIRRGLDGHAIPDAVEEACAVADWQRGQLAQKGRNLRFHRRSDRAPRLAGRATRSPVGHHLPGRDR